MGEGNLQESDLFSMPSPLVWGEGGQPWGRMRGTIASQMPSVPLVYLLDLSVMDDREFLKVADECLGRVAKWLEDFDPDEADYSTADGSVSIEFPDGGKFILSRQSATKQVWLAAEAHGYHYNLDPKSNRWIDDRDGHDLFSRLAEVVGGKVGHRVEFDK
jgi:CyaY protein